MSGNISIGHFSHTTRPLAFNSEADAIKMALENLPSIKGSVTVLRRSFFSGPGENRMASNFRCVAGGNVGSLSVDTSKLSGTSVFSNVTIVEPGTSTVGGSFRLRLHDDTNTVTSIILHNESAANIQRKITEELGLNVSVAQSSKNDVTGAISWDIAYVNKHTDARSIPHLEVPPSSNMISGANAGIMIKTLQNASYIPLSGTLALQLLGNNMEKTRQFDFNISASGLRTVLEEAFDGAKNVEVSRSKLTSSEGYIWAVTFHSYRSAHNPNFGYVPMLAADASSLNGTNPTASVSSVKQAYGPSVDVEVTNNGVTYTNSYLQYEYVPSIVLGTLEPLSGPSTGGTRLTIALGRYDDYDANPFIFEPYRAINDEVYCRFDETVVRATILSSVNITCSTPPHSVGQVEVSVSVNGQEYSSSTLSYTYHAAAHNITLSPRIGPISGGTLIRITGSDFTDDIESAKCSFGEEIVNAVYATQFEIRCHAPPVVSPKKCLR